MGNTDEHILDDNLVNANSILDPNENLASSGKRFANMIIDLIGYYVLAAIIGIGLGIVGKVSYLEGISGTFFSILIMFIYFFVLESLFGKSLGKMITKTKVVMEDGSKPSNVQIMKRTLGRFIPFDGFSFLGKSIGWHDSISKTRVVNDK